MGRRTDDVLILGAFAEISVKLYRPASYPIHASGMTDNVYTANYNLAVFAKRDTGVTAAERDGFLRCHLNLLAVKLDLLRTSDRCDFDIRNHIRFSPAALHQPDDDGLSDIVSREKQHRLLPNIPRSKPYARARQQSAEFGVAGENDKGFTVASKANERPDSYATELEASRTYHRVDAARLVTLARNGNRVLLRSIVHKHVSPSPGKDPCVVFLHWLRSHGGNVHSISSA